jgi:cation diffusion facilitator CzcD-associated flavoprotein CzcO
MTEGIQQAHHRACDRALEADIAIIGAGYAGIGMAIQLRRAGLRSFVILERSHNLGGVWHANRYPGCACDVPTQLYSYSFEQSWQWSCSYAPSSEILAYLQYCARKYEIGSHVEFGCEVVAAEFDDRAKSWRIRTRSGRIVCCRVLVCAVGSFSHPSIPSLTGLRDFQGRVTHTAMWSDEFDIDGRDVAVVGTGASAVQLIPAIADRVRRLYVFQRTPPWVVPKMDPHLARWERWLYHALGGKNGATRTALYWRNERLGVAMTKRRDYLARLEAFMRQLLSVQVADEELRSRVTPQYALGCNIILISNEYYPAISRANVRVLASPIARVEPSAIVTADDKTHAVDCIVFATGFDIGGLLRTMNVVGRDGVRLADTWRDGFKAYLGCTISGFPNFFMLGGPNSGTAHTSGLLMIEAQIDYILRCLRTMRHRRASAMEVRPEAQARFDRMLQARMPQTVWTSGCASWLRDANGRVFTMWPGTTTEYWLRTRCVRTRDFSFA